ncbi:Dynein light chain 4, axonemal [Coelomomyces lativittatus]|nr:Dynein light chain 4, axonemal [Coelomomyces lativittatus]
MATTLSDSNPNLAEKAGGEGSKNMVSNDVKDNEKESKKVFNYPLVKYTDMGEELRIETVDMVVTYLEKHPGNYEAAAKNVKELMDKKCGTSWHVVIGEGFEFEITYEMRNLLFMYFGTFGVLLWKAN